MAVKKRKPSADAHVPNPGWKAPCAAFAPPARAHRKALNVWVSADEHNFLRRLADDHTTTIVMELRILLREAALLRPPALTGKPSTSGYPPDEYNFLRGLADDHTSTIVMELCILLREAMKGSKWLCPTNVALPRNPTSTATLWAGRAVVGHTGHLQKRPN